MTTPAALRSSPPGRWQDYVQLLKPRVMSLVVFTAATGLICTGAPLHPVMGAIAILCIAVGALYSWSHLRFLVGNVVSRSRR